MILAWGVARVNDDGRTEIVERGLSVSAAERRAAGENEDLDSFVARVKRERADIALLTGGGLANSH